MTIFLLILSFAYGAMAGWFVADAKSWGRIRKTEALYIERMSAQAAAHKQANRQLERAVAKKIMEIRELRWTLHGVIEGDADLEAMINEKDRVDYIKASLGIEGKANENH